MPQLPRPLGEVVPDNPNVPTLLQKAGAAQDAQRKLRDSMAAVAAELSPVTAAQKAAGQPARPPA